MKTLMFVILSAVISALSTLLIVHYFYESEVVKFVNSQIAIQERISTDVFNHYPLESSNFVQINYSVFFKKAYDAGLINSFEYNRAASIANTRLCISYEITNHAEEANRFCKWAMEHLLQWRRGLSFSEFKRIITLSREKKEIPEVSLEIIQENIE